MKHLIIIGVGGFAREVHWHAQSSLGYGTEWDIKGFLDGDVKLDEQEYKKLPLPLLGDIESYEAEAEDVFICAIADCVARERLTKRMELKSAVFINLIHCTALIAPTAKIGIGCIIAFLCHVGPDTTVGNHVIINARSGMAHDVQVDDYCSFMGNSGLMGYAKAGRRVYFADSAKALPHAIIEDDVYIGVNSVVFKRAKQGQKLFGNPASPIDW